MYLALMTVNGSVRLQIFVSALFLIKITNIIKFIFFVNNDYAAIALVFWFTYFTISASIARGTGTGVVVYQISAGSSVHAWIGVTLICV